MINGESLELRGESVNGERSIEYRVQRTEYNCRADYFIRQRDLRIKQISWLPCGVCTCLHVSQVSRG